MGGISEVQSSDLTVTRDAKILKFNWEDYMNNLIIFDIDGTLINTFKLEDELYIDAVYRSLKKEFTINTNWDLYQYSTDAGVFSEIVNHHFARGPSAQEQHLMEALFVESINQAFIKTPTLWGSLPGAEFIFQTLKSIGWDVAIATGGWHKSALLKLNKANLYHNNVPLASSNDAFHRKDIIQIAIARAQTFYKKSAYSKIFYVGDKAWDKRAADDLNIDFIGIGDNWASLDNPFLHIQDYKCSKLVDYLKQI